MHTYNHIISRTIRVQAKPQQKWLVALSGGADSTALLMALHHSGQKIAAAHFNHNLRGEASDADASWTQDLCSKHGIEYHSSSGQVEEYAKEQKTCIETAARELRYKYLSFCAKENNCDCIVTAHTANDQAETILHNIIRGTGINGLIGIHAEHKYWSRIPVVRPLLRVTRHDIEDYLKLIRQDYCQDLTNFDLEYTRNAIRHELLPMLRKFNPRADEALARLGQQAYDSNEFIESHAAKLATGIVSHGDKFVNFKKKIFELDKYIIRTIVASAWKFRTWREYTPRCQLTFNHLDDVVNIHNRGMKVGLPGSSVACITDDGDLLIHYNG